MFEFVKSVFCRRKTGVPVEFATLSERGLVRPDNQDHFLVLCERGFFCVADGMGGGEGGAKASEIACAAMKRMVSRSKDFPGMVKAAAGAVCEANSEIREYAKKAGYRQMATTVTALMIDRERTGDGVIGYVGDSRAYRYRGGELAQLTHDHTLAGELSRSKAASRAAAAQLGARAGMLAHILTRAVGIEPDVQTEWRKIDVKSGDLYLVCTDGVYDMLAQETIREACAAGGQTDEIVRRLARLIVEAGAEDNYTIVAFRIGGDS